MRPANFFTHENHVFHQRHGNGALVFGEKISLLNSSGMTRSSDGSEKNTYF